MLEKPDALHTVGLLSGPETIKGVQLSFFRGKPRLEHNFEAPIDFSQPIGDINPLLLSDEGRILNSYAKKSLVVTSLDANETIVRPLEVKLKKDKDVDAVIGFQSEPLLPYPLDQAIVDWIKLSQSAESTMTTIVAARKDHIQKHLNLCASLDIDPEVISSLPVALALFSKYFSQNERYQYTIEVSFGQVCCALVREGKLIACQASTHGVQQLLSAYAKDRESTSEKAKDDFLQFDFNQIPVHYSHLTAAMQALHLDLMRIIFSMSKHTRGKEVNGLMITGDAALLLNFSKVLCKMLKKVEIAPLKNPEFVMDLQQILYYAIPIGLAISGLPDDSDQINFRQQEFVYPRPWKRFIKPISLYLILCVGLALAMYTFGNAYLGYSSDKLRVSYLDLLTYMRKPYSDFEAEYAKKMGMPKSVDGSVLNIEDLSPEEIGSRLRILEKEVQASPESFPLMPNTPRVSDVLAWLQSHPNVVSKDETTGNVNPLIQIDSFSYTMVKRPESSKRQERYQIKVEIEFSTQTPKQAREFHDSLLAPNELVDPKGEVKWTTNRGKYRASFFLKDRTSYPPG